MATAIATLHCFGHKCGEDRFEIKVEIGAPYKSRKHPENWACAVRLEPFLDRVRDVYGVDSFQALSLAIGFVQMLLNQYCAEGGSLSYEDGSEFSISPNVCPSDISTS